MTLYVAGPTGSGKSAFALQLAEALDGEIVNADAFQVYREIPILTAQPEADALAAVPHHLYGILGVAENCDAGRYLGQAKPVLEDIISRGKTAIVVGGSGLYIKALTHGLQDAPPASAELRQELDVLSTEALVSRLNEQDPEAAAAIDPRNRRYVQRALEIVLTTGRSWIESRQAWKEDVPHLQGILFLRDRQDLYARIDARVHSMFARGAVEEVRSVVSWSENAPKAIGVREIQALLRGEMEREPCIAAIQQASRRYAKRQMTWFRRENWLRPVDVSEESMTPSLEELCVEFATKPPENGHF